MNEDSFNAAIDFFTEQIAGRDLLELKALLSHLTDEELMKERRAIIVEWLIQLNQRKDKRNKGFKSIDNNVRIYNAEMYRRRIEDKGWLTPKTLQEIKDIAKERADNSHSVEGTK